MPLHEESSRVWFWTLGVLFAVVDFATFTLLAVTLDVAPFYSNAVSVAVAMICVALPKLVYVLRGSEGGPEIGALNYARLAAYTGATVLICSWCLAQFLSLGVDLLLAKAAVTAAAVLINYLPLDRFFVKGRFNYSSLGVGVALCGVLLGAQKYLPKLLYPIELEPELAALYKMQTTPLQEKMRVFHLGHSLVGRDMPAMLAQLAGHDHRYELQLGWGTSLREHWEPELKINGFVHENATPRYRDARAALASGEYDAFVMTEMIGLRDAIRWHGSSCYAGKWARAAFVGRSDIRVYVYETWHPLDDPADWLQQISQDLKQLWLPRILWPAVRATERPIYLVPAGQVMSRLVREVESRPDGLHGMRNRWDLFAIDQNGKQDNIHLSDLGMYLVALTHYATLYGKTVVGFPRELLHADGTPAQAPSPELAKRMQEIVWEVVSSKDLTGVKAEAASDL